MINSKSKICFVLTTEFSVRAFLLSHLQVLSNYYAVTVITNTSNPSFLTDLAIPVDVIQVNLDRNIRVFSDLKNLFILVGIFKRQGFSAVHSVTPKAGLLAMLAAWFVRTPIRVHTFTGQVWATKAGAKRLLLKYIDKVMVALTTETLIDSPSQREFLISEKITYLSKSIVFAKGSISGVDVSRFKPNIEIRTIVRGDLGLTEEDVLFLFIGRLTVDKGVLDLADAFSNLQNKNVHLLFVGPDEQNMEPKILKKQTAKSLTKVHFIGHTNHPESYMAAADVLCLPSYREGFGTVLIEAAAVGTPAIASRIYGITDAVVDDETGLLHAPHDIIGIKKHLATFANSPELIVKLGSQARERATKDFNSELISEAWVKFYQDRLA